MNLREELDKSRADDVVYLVDTMLPGASFQGTRRDLCRLLKIAEQNRGGNSCWSEGYLAKILDSLSQHLPQRGITWYREGAKMVLTRVGHSEPEQLPDTAKFLPVLCDDDCTEVVSAPPAPIEEVPPPLVKIKGETSVVLRARGQRSIRVTGTISDITHIAIGLAFAQ